MTALAGAFAARAAAQATLVGAARTWLSREGILLPTVAAVALLVVAFTPYALGPDTWVALVSGREVAEHGVPSANTLTALAAGAPWVDQQWLAQLALYGVTVAGGVRLALLANVLLVVGTFVLGVVAARRLGASARATSLIAAATIPVAPWAWQLRTQTIALPLFVGLVWLLASESRRPTWRIALVAPLLAVWANVHGSVLLASALVGTYALTTRDVRRGLAVFAAAAAAPFASPYGLALIDYYRATVANEALREVVTEWQPPASTRLGVPFFLLVALGLGLVARKRTRLTPCERALLVLTAAAGAVALRNVVWFALAAIVLLPRTLDGRPLRRRAHAAAGIAGAATLAATAVFLATRPPAWFESRWPVAVADAAAATPSARVFASERFADWLLWRRPELRGRIAFDARFELLPPSQLRKLSAFHHRRGGRWRDAARGYGVLVLERENAAVIRALDAEPESRVVARAGDAVVIVRRGGR